MDHAKKDTSTPESGYQEHDEMLLFNQREYVRLRK